VTGLILCICTLSGAFFAGLETGLVSANQYALYAAREKGAAYARAAGFLLLKPERLLSTTLIGTNLSYVTASIVLGHYLRSTGVSWVQWIGSPILTVLLLIVAEIIPKSFFRKNADNIAVRLAPVLVVFFFLFSPMSVILNTVIKLILLVTGHLHSSNAVLDSKHSLRTLVRLGSREANIPLGDQRIIDDIFDFQDTIAREIMTHIHQTPAFPESMTLEEISRQALQDGIRFVPIYRQRLDNLIGYIDLEELVTSKSSDVSENIHEPVFFPDTKRISELYQEISGSGLQVAFLSNEYGRVTGMITPADIVAQIVRIQPGARLRKLEEIAFESEDEFLVAGSADIQSFRTETRIMLPDGPYDTVGGFLLTRFGRIPENGESLSILGAVFTVIDRDEVHIRRIRVNRTIP
jgi:putative hemolysin